MPTPAEILAITSVLVTITVIAVIANDVWEEADAVIRERLEALDAEDLDQRADADDDW